MIVKTEFNMGQKVWYIVEEDRYKVVCAKCGAKRKMKHGKWVVKGPYWIVHIYISRFSNGEIGDEYVLRYEGIPTEIKTCPYFIFASKKEALHGCKIRQKKT